eukprot:744105-Hanusia_phi.AAC.1
MSLRSPSNIAALSRILAARTAAAARCLRASSTALRKPSKAAPFSASASVSSSFEAATPLVNASKYIASLSCSIR